MIECRNICFSISSSTLLHDISWSFSPRKITAILGANGAGKSTFMRTLLGGLKPDSGSVEYQGKSLRQWSLQELALSRAYMAQSGNVRLGISVLDYLLLARVHRREDQAIADRYVQDVIQTLVLDSLVFKNIDELSGGEYQRVELARAWSQLVDENQLQNKLLLLDEPASALDINQSQKLYHYLKHFVAAGGSVVVVEHDLNMAAKFCDEIILLRDGECLAAGDKHGVFTEANINSCFNVSGHLVRDENRNTVSFSL